jgi:hypothetical protein
LLITVLSGGVAVAEAELLGASASGTAVEILPISAVDAVSGVGVANMQPAEVIKTISKATVNAKNQLYLSMFISSI